MKNIYMVELRKRVNQNVNKEIEQFGAFSSTESAQKWIRKEGKFWAKTYKQKSGFYSIIEYCIDSYDGGLYKESYDLNGDKTYLFKK